MRIHTTMLTLLLIIFWSINVWAAENQKTVVKKKVWVQNGEKKVGLGVMVSKVDKDNSGTTKEGARIVEVIKGSEAEKIGLKRGDIIVALNGETIKEPSDLVDIIDGIDEGEEVTLSILRDGQKKSFTATLNPFEGHAYAFHTDNEEGDVENEVFMTPGQRKELRIIRPSGINATINGKGGYLGVQVRNLTDQLKEYFEVKNGVLIDEVMKDSPAEKSGLKAGDIIVSINDRKIEDYQDLVRTINYYNPEEEVSISYVRKGDTEETRVILDKKPPYQRMGYDMRGPRGLQFFDEDGGNRVFITDEGQVDKGESGMNVEIEKEFFIL